MKCHYAHLRPLLLAIIIFTGVWLSLTKYILDTTGFGSQEKSQDDVAQTKIDRLDEEIQRKEKILENLISGKSSEKLNYFRLKLDYHRIIIYY